MKSIKMILVWLCLVQIQPKMAEAGGLVLQFDDGWTQWRTLIAPELQRVNGRATGFINNQFLLSGRITREDILALQNEYDWEIGTHTYTHVSAPRYVQQNGLEAWLADQLDKSIEELEQAGVRVRSLVFPFNAYTPEIAAALGDRVDSYRRVDPLALASGTRPDGSVPGTSIDLTRYIPLRMLYQWIDMAAARNEYLFLYGHRVVPDEECVVGTVVSVDGRVIETDVDVTLPEGEDLVLVPDVARRGLKDSPKVIGVNGRFIEVADDDVARHTRPGATFLIGPAYGTRLSDFRALLEYAEDRLPFLRLKDLTE